MGIKEICDTIKTMVDNYTRSPFAAISGLIMVCSLAKRPGLSVLISTSNIIKNMAKYGINTDVMEDGTPNQLNIYTKCIVAEVFRALREDANIQTASGPGSSTSVGIGANGGGPIFLKSYQDNYSKGNAAIF